MHDSGFKRWVVLGALASASWLVSACGALPQSGDTYAVAPGFTRTPEQTGYNGTIRDIPTSIDPRTPETAGVQGRSLRMDAGERALLESQRGLGGSGSTPPAKRPGGGPLYEGLGAEGSVIAPSQELPASQSTLGDDRPANLHAPARAPATHDERSR